MTEPLGSAAAGGPASSWIDRQCDQFERDWQQGRNPRIEDVLDSLPPDQRRPMLQELLGVEIELRQRKGEEIKRHEYQTRFPDAIDLLNSFSNAFAPELEATLPNTDPGTVPNSATTSTRYRDLRFHRRGGLGELYRAVDDSLHRETVIKFMHEACRRDPALVAQFRVEAEITSRLDHPGIVPVYGLGQDWHGRPFYVMRLINGRELKQAIAEYHQAGGPGKTGNKNRQLLFNLLEHLVSACNTIAYAHHVGIVHCDIKPANIMIGKYGETFVLDWGLATSFERTSTFFVVNEPTMRPHSAPSGSTSGQRGGTYGYISPEQLCGDGPLGPTSDVYSLGATLYEILTGQAPFSGRDKDVLEQVRCGRFPMPRSLQPGISRRLEAIVLKAMHLSPMLRYPTAKHVSDDLTNYMRDEEIEAAPDRWLDRVGRFARRHRGIAAAAFITAITLVVAIAWTDRSVRQAKHQSDLLDNAKLLQEQEKKTYEAEKKTHEAEKMSFTTALDTFEDLCGPLANGELNNLGAFRRIADKVKDFTAVYLNSFKDNDNMRLHTGRVYELRGTVYSPTDPVHALEDYQLAEKMYSQYKPEPAEQLQHQLRLAHVQVGQGRLLQQRREYGPAERVLKSVIANLVDLRNTEKNNETLLRDLAEAYHLLGEVFLSREGLADARTQSLEDSLINFGESKKIREQLVETFLGPESSNHKRDLARSLGYLGDLYLARGNVRQAAKSYEDSLTLRRELYTKNTHDPEHRFQYSRGLANFGTLELNYRGDLAGALPRLVEARDLQQELANDFPEVQSIQRDLASTQNLLAEIYLLVAQNEDDAAAENLKRSRDAANAANIVSGNIYISRASQEDKDGIAGMALSQVILSLLDRESDPAKSLQLLQQADKQLLELGPEATMSYDDLVTLSLVRSLQGKAAAAWQELQVAMKRGENGVNRWELHKSLGYRAIADDPKLGVEFKNACEVMRQSLIDK